MPGHKLQAAMSPPWSIMVTFENFPLEPAASQCQFLGICCLAGPSPADMGNAYGWESLCSSPDKTIWMGAISRNNIIYFCPNWVPPAEILSFSCPSRMGQENTLQSWSSSPQGKKKYISKHALITKIPTESIPFVKRSALVKLMTLPFQTETYIDTHTPP